jgi:hypothetical protein
MGEIIGLARPPAKQKQPKWVWLDTIRADARLQNYPHVGRRFLCDLAVELTKFPSFSTKGIYAGTDTLGKGLGVTSRQIRRGVAALRELGHLIVARRGRAKTSLLIPAMDGKPLFPDAMTGPEGPFGQDRKVRNDRTGRSAMIGPERPHSLLTENQTLDTNHSYHTIPLPPSSVCGKENAVDEEGLTLFGRSAFNAGLEFAFEDSDPWKHWLAERGPNGMPPIDVRLMQGKRRRGAWFPSLYPRTRPRREMTVKRSSSDDCFLRPSSTGRQDMTAVAADPASYAIVENSEAFKQWCSYLRRHRRVPPLVEDIVGDDGRRCRGFYMPEPLPPDEGSG